MFKLVKTVNPEMQKQYGSWWPSNLTRDLIHAICLDKVRNNNARERKKLQAGPSSNVQGSNNGKRLRKTPVDSSSDESSDQRRGIPAVKQKAPLPPLVDPITPRQRAITPFVPTSRRSLTSRLGSGVEELMSTSPLLSTPGNYQLPGITPTYLVDPLLTMDRVVSSASLPTQGPTPAGPITPVSRKPSLTIYVAGRKPLYTLIDSGWQGFIGVVEQVLTWSEAQFLQYRPIGGERSPWMPLCVEEEFEKLLKTCCDTGVKIRVVPDNWFHSEAEEESEGENNVEQVRT